MRDDGSAGNDRWDGGPELLASAVAIKPVLARNAAEAETLRRLPPESFDALRRRRAFSG